MNTHDQAEHARLANTPWRGDGAMRVKARRMDNVAANQAAFKRMSLLERETGMSHEQYEAFHAEQRQRVLARYGIAS